MLRCPECNSENVDTLSLYEKKCGECGHVGTTTEFWPEPEGGTR